ncbi:serine racemase [Cladochytrium replicatum]|nr:serine racemase [Cladochytrium replicatum]
MSRGHAITLSDVQCAASVVKGYVHRTPVLTSSTLSSDAGCTLLFKCENFQRIGAFKFRGAFHAVSRLVEQAAERGEKLSAVVTHSSGNHAQALALAAEMASIPAFVVMPTNAPQVKKDAVRGYGATIVECEPTIADRELTAARVLSEHPGSVFIAPYNEPLVMAGQGTAMLEFLEQSVELTGRELDAVIIPVGGGGLISGCSIAGKGMKPGLHIFGAEPATADDAMRTLHAFRSNPTGDICTTPLPNIAPPKSHADGLLSQLGSNTWPIVRDHVEEIFTATEEEIVRAMKYVWERMKIVIEPSSAVPIAIALYSKEFQEIVRGKQVGIVVGGGNVDLAKIPWTESATKLRVDR